MRRRGRRVALLLATALPLLADNRLTPVSEHPAVTTTITSTLESATSPDSDATHSSNSWNRADLVDTDPFHVDDENDDDGIASQYKAAEAIHNDGFHLPPLSSQKLSHDYVVKEQVHDKDETIVSKSSTTAELPTDQPLDKLDNLDSDHLSTNKTGTTNQTAIEKDEGISTSSDSISNQTTVNLSSSTVLDENVNNNTQSSEKASDDVKNSSSTINLTNTELETQNDTDSTVLETIAEEQEEEEDDDEVSLSRVSVDYASKSAGALIIEKSSGFKGTSNLLNSDKDKYAIAPCEDKKFVVISLSEDILVKQIKLSNYERFSSSVKDFQVMGSQTLGKWFDLGTYSAKSGNGEQVFDLAEPAWARYLKFKFLSHHGVEYYCTYSQIQVHGSTMVQGFHEQWEESEENESDELVSDNSSHVGMENSTKEPDSSPTTQTDDQLMEDGAIDVSDTSQSNSAKTSGGLDTKVDSPKSGSVEAVVGGTETHGSRLEDKLLSDQLLFASLYDLIPSTLSALPSTSRDSPGRQTTGGELRTLHQLGSLAIQSIFSTTKPSGDDSKTSTDDLRSSIVTPRMTDAIGHYLKTELGLLTSRWMHPEIQEPLLRSLKQVVDLTKNNSESKMDNTSETLSDDEVKSTTNVSKEIPEPMEKEAPTDSESNKVDIKNSSEMQQDAPPSKGSNLSSAVSGTGSSTEYSIDAALAKMLEDLPSAECLHQLDYSEFKARLSTSKKSQSGPGTSSSSGPNQMEPIFKKLTDEIRALQSNLQVHDQFAKLSAACYQRVLLDLIVATDQLRTDHDERLRTLERQFRESQHSIIWKVSCTLFHALRSVAMWLYRTIIHIYSPLIIWCSSLGKGCLRIPGMLYRYALLRWPVMKSFFLTNKDGSTSEWAELLLPVTDLIDQLLVDMKVADSNFTPEEADSLARENDEMWKFPVLPIVLLILIGRIVMCFANNPSVRVSKFSTGSSPARWKSLSSSPSKTVMSKGASSSTRTTTVPEPRPIEASSINQSSSSSAASAASPSLQPRCDQGPSDQITKPSSSMEQPSEVDHHSPNEHRSPTHRISRIPAPSRRSVVSPRNGTTNRVTP